ncbi:MAG TPA: DUF1501 domain-containing protein [Thermoanaerobaculia bacterium]
MSLTRRSFLRQSVCAAAGATALANTIFDLRRVAAAAALPTLSGDYKALVCVFLYGGNDGNNMIIPASGTDYQAYARDRATIAVPQASLLPITPLSGGDGRPWALHPSLPQLKALFDQQKLALLANVGPLVAPLSRTAYLNGSTAVPPQLFSHSDQTVHWQTSLPDQPARTGWGGRTADLLRVLNGTSQVSMSFSLYSANTFEVANFVTQYQLSNDGTLELGGFDPDPATTDPFSRTLRGLLARSYGNLFDGAYAATMKRAIDNDALLRGALAGVTLPATVTFPDSDLGQQLQMVARMIGARDALGQRRQIFFCAAGGYATHGDQLAAQQALLADLDAALGTFYQCTSAMGVASSVTAFTASDFGRTWPDNGGGTDHAWGNHHLILGGAVLGGRLYGHMPTLASDGPDDAGDDGRWIPTTSVDEYSPTLARWFGVQATDMSTVFPNLGRFAHPNLGFLG